MADDLDDILSSALDEVVLDDDEQKVPPTSTLQSAASKTAELQQTGAETAATQAASAPDDELGALLKMLSGEGGGELEKVLDEAFKDLDLNSLMEKLGVPADGEPADIDEAMKKLMQAKEGEGVPSELLEKMVQKLEADLGEDGMEKMMKGMMKQFMSKEVMYGPIKQVTEAYPGYLEANKKALSKEDLARYENQLSGYRALLGIFDNDPDNLDQIARILHDVQQFGDPPQEIVKLLQPQAGAGGPMPPPPPQCPQQ